MPIWEKLRTELDRAGKVAQGALDEGKIRLDAFRARKRADKAAQVLGYAVYRSVTQNTELAADVLARLSADVGVHETEAARLEAQLADIEARTKTAGT